MLKITACIKRIFYFIWPVPLLLTRRILGKNPWPLEGLFVNFTGVVIGKIARPFFKRKGDFHHALAPNVALTNFVENMLGIRGKDEYLDEYTVRRTVTQCPYCRRKGASVICHFGDALGNKIFNIFIPGSTVEIKKAQSWGDDYCEYIFSGPLSGTAKSEPATAKSGPATAKSGPATASEGT